MNKKALLLIAIIIVVVAAYMGVRMYNAEVPNASGMNVDIRVQADALFNAFEADEVAAGTAYNDKVIEVTGVVRDITRASDGRMSVLLETGDPLGAVVCEFPDATDGLAVGSEVVIKGFCAGFNLDVLLQRCALTGTRDPDQR
ncbi:MAG: OB-fold putative lipoprotein [Flavobacteriales bacterium]|nr:OB-fold putative lipoprotein [Flavobacteriales bacterium]